MKTRLYQWAKMNSVLLMNASSLIGTTVVTSGLGFVYWWAAARLFSPDVIGMASASISAMMFLGTISIVGLGTLLLGELSQGKKESLISITLIVAGGVGGCVGIVFALAALFVTSHLQMPPMKLADVLLFALGVSLTSITLILDQALLRLWQSRLQFWRKILFALTKLAALFAASFWLSHTIGLTLYATWAIGNALSLVVIAGCMLLQRGGLGSWLAWKELRKLRPRPLQHYMLHLMLQAPALVLPVLVTVLLSATANAWFYISWMITCFAFIVPATLTMVVYATVSGQPTALAHKMRLTLSLACVTGIIATCLLQLGARPVLELFGHVYAQQATLCLRILSLGSFPIIIKHHYVTICHIQNRVTQATRLITVGGFLELGGAALGAHLGGLPGLCLGWVIIIGSTVIFMLPIVYKSVVYP